MITFRRLGYYGRTGNQMFQYACLYSVAKRNNYDFGVPYYHKHENPYQNFSLPDYFKNLTALDCSHYLAEHFYEPNRWSYDDEVFNIKDNTDIVGYFQSEKYFDLYKDELKKEFCFKDEILEHAINQRKDITDPVISVHIRMGDYKHLQNKHPICLENYYKKSLDFLPKDIPLILFTDSPNEIYSIFSKLNKKYFISHNFKTELDLCLMTLCDYHIIANSSFSWWGSWLSNSKETIAPSNWFGPDSGINDWNDIYCKNWRII